MNLGRMPTGPFNALLNRRSDPYILYSIETTEDSYNTEESLVSTGVTVQMDVYGQQSTPDSYPTGDVANTSIRGMMTVNEYTDACEDGVCIVHGGVVYKVLFDAWPDSLNTQVYVLSLTEQQGLTPP